MLTITVQRARGAGEPSGRSITARRWFSNWLVTAPSWVQWPVLCGRIASSLTSTRPSVVSKSSTARIAGDVERAGHGERELLGAGGQVGVEVGRRGDHLGADAVALGRLDDRVRRRLTARRPGHQGGELAAEVDQLLGEDAYAARRGGREGLGAVVGGADHPHALAVVPAAGGLEDRREAERGDLLAAW